MRRIGMGSFLGPSSRTWTFAPSISTNREGGVAQRLASSSTGRSFCHPMAIKMAIPAHKTTSTAIAYFNIIHPRLKLIKIHYSLDTRRIRCELLKNCDGATPEIQLILGNECVGRGLGAVRGRLLAYCAGGF